MEIFDKANSQLLATIQNDKPLVARYHLVVAAAELEEEDGTVLLPNEGEPMPMIE
jgi:hypothetical protein